jgi:hypothetical protein
MGMDSLMAVELGNRLARATGTELGSTVAFEYPTVHALGDHIAHDVLGLPRADDTAAPSVGADRRDRVAELQQISEDEAERSLLEELSRSGY